MLNPVLLFSSFIIFCLILPLLLLEFLSFHRKNKEEGMDLYQNDQGHHIYYDRSLIEKTWFLNHNPNVHPRELRTLSRFYKEFFQSPSYLNTFDKDN